jgi:hypothetical protein
MNRCGSADDHARDGGSDETAEKCSRDAAFAAHDETTLARCEQRDRHHGIHRPGLDDESDENDRERKEHGVVVHASDHPADHERREEQRPLRLLRKARLLEEEAENSGVDGMARLQCEHDSLTRGLVRLSALRSVCIRISASVWCNAGFSGSMAIARRIVDSA